MSTLSCDITHFHVFDEEDIESSDAEQSAHRLEVLAKLAAEQLPLTSEQSSFLRAVMPREYGAAQDHNAHALVWSLRTEGPHGEIGVLRVRIAHDHAVAVELSFSPPSKGTWVDESSAFSQEDLVIAAPERGDDPTGGKAIAARLLARLAAS